MASTRVRCTDYEGEEREREGGRGEREGELGGEREALEVDIWRQ